VNLYKSDIVEIESSDNQILHFEADGEYLGEGAARFSIVKDGIRILVPRKGSEM
jgi:diacylglycerol kinase family enzyme